MEIVCPSHLAPILIRGGHTIIDNEDRAAVSAAKIAVIDPSPRAAAWLMFKGYPRHGKKIHLWRPWEPIGVSAQQTVDEPLFSRLIEKEEERIRIVESPYLARFVEDALRWGQKEDCFYKILIDSELFFPIEKNGCILCENRKERNIEIRGVGKPFLGISLYLDGDKFFGYSLDDSVNWINIFAREYLKGSIEFPFPMYEWRKRDIIRINERGNALDVFGQNSIRRFRIVDAVIGKIKVRGYQYVELEGKFSDEKNYILGIDPCSWTSSVIGVEPFWEQAPWLLSTLAAGRTTERGASVPQESGGPLVELGVTGSTRSMEVVEDVLSGENLDEVSEEQRTSTPEAPPLSSETKVPCPLCNKGYIVEKEDKFVCSERKISPVKEYGKTRFVNKGECGFWINKKHGKNVVIELDIGYLEAVIDGGAFVPSVNTHTGKDGEVWVFLNTDNQRNGARFGFKVTYNYKKKPIKLRSF